MPLDPSDLFQYGQQWSGRLIDLLRQLGQSAVPAGGTTGQVLEKASNADNDTVWADGGGSVPEWEAVTVPTDAAAWDALGNAVFVPAAVLADAAPTLPLTIVAATNDQFAFNFFEVFTVAPGVYTTVAQCAAAMAAAIGSGSGERWDTLATPSVSGGKILNTAITAENDDAISDSSGGNGAAAALGFTSDPDRFAGGLGGAWFFNAGVISTTNQAVQDSVIVTTVDNFGQAWAVECEIMVADHTSYTAAFNAGAWLYQAAISQELDGSGFQVTSAPRIDTNLAGNLESSATAIVDENWHTVRAVNLPLVQQSYFDGTLVGQTFTAPSQGQADGLKESRFLLYDGVGGTQFRNLKAWRIPLPTFPA